MNAKKIYLILPLTAAMIAGTSLAFGKDRLAVRPPVEQIQQHLTWQAFQQALLSYPMVTSQMGGNGIVSIQGHVESGVDRSYINNLALKVEGATDVDNRILID